MTEERGNLKLLGIGVFIVQRFWTKVLGATIKVGRATSVYLGRKLPEPVYLGRELWMYGVYPQAQLRRFLNALNAPPSANDGVGGGYTYFVDNILKFGKDQD
ncbi:hypothetical protein K438DRAFT_1775671 [Mycena galopus ATCC 62051]|nr:hypothetical protein K438DRAFT_1775671 [Mycena galopus ATCC 62051]